MAKEITKEFIIKENLKNVVDDEEIMNAFVMLILVVVIYEDVLIISFFILRCCRNLSNGVDGIVNVISVYGPFLIAIRRSSSLSL